MCEKDSLASMGIAPNRVSDATPSTSNRLPSPITVTVAKIGALSYEGAPVAARAVVGSSTVDNVDSTVQRVYMLLEIYLSI